MSSLKDIDPQTETELQAAAFRALREHLQSIQMCKISI